MLSSVSRVVLVSRLRRVVYGRSGLVFWQVAKVQETADDKYDDQDKNPAKCSGARRTRLLRLVIVVSTLVLIAIHVSEVVHCVSGRRLGYLVEIASLHRAT